MAAVETTKHTDFCVPLNLIITKPNSLKDEILYYLETSNFKTTTLLALSIKIQSSCDSLPKEVQEIACHYFVTARNQNETSLRLCAKAFEATENLRTKFKYAHLKWRVVHWIQKHL